MSDAWEEIQAIKSKRHSLRERLEKRKKERQDILGSSLGAGSPVNLSESLANSYLLSTSSNVKEEQKVNIKDAEDLVRIDPELEKGLLKELSEVTLQLPVSSSELLTSLKLTSDRDTTHKRICNLLEKFAIQKLITVKTSSKDGINLLEVSHVEVSKVNAMILEFTISGSEISKDVLKRKRDEESPAKNNENEEERKKKEKKEPKADIMVFVFIYK